MARPAPLALGSVLAAALLVLLAIGGLRGGGGAPEATPLWPAIEPSVVFGAPGAPTSGQVTVGLLVCYPPAVRLVDRLGPDALARFERVEAEIAAGTAPPVLSDLDVLSVENLSDLRPLGWEATLSALSAAAVTVREALGVQVSFRHLPAPRAAEVPLVLVSPGPVGARDLAALARAAEAGVRIAGGAEAAVGERHAALFGDQPGHAPDAKALAALVLEVVRTSPRVVRLPDDPLRVRSALRAGGEILVAFATTPAQAALEGLDGAPAGPALVEPDGSVRLAAPEPQRDARRTRLVVVSQAHGLRLRRAYPLDELVGALDRRVFAPAVVEAGSDVAPRVLVHNSLTGAPVVGAREQLRLEAGVPPVVLSTAEGLTDVQGSLVAVLNVPESAPPGPAALVVGGERLTLSLQPGLRLSLVTERALYRPTDDVHVRLMAHRAGSGRPVADLPVTLTLGTVEKRVTTSAHGIASARFRLVEAELGRAAVEAKAGGVLASAAFTVRAFELPTFAVAVEPPTLALRHGEQAPVSVRVRYNDGAPVVGAHVEAWGGTALLPTAVQARTDAQGLATLVVVAGRSGEADTLRVDVRDADGRRAAATVEVLAAGQTRAGDVDVEPLGDLCVGRPGQVALRPLAAGPLRVCVDGGPEQALALDAGGRCVLALTPSRPEVVLLVRLGGAAPTRLALHAVAPDPVRLHVLADRRTWSVGERLELTLIGPDGPAYVDLDRGDLTVAGVSTVLREGQARVSLPLEAAHAGLLGVRAWQLAPGGAGEPRGSVTSVLVLRGRSLRVTAEPGAGAYRPGETAEVDVRVRDRAGRPVTGVLGWWGVDEALLRLMPWAPSTEAVFDVLPVGGPRGPAAAAAERVERGEPGAWGDLAELVGPAARPFDDLVQQRRARLSDAALAPVRLAAERQAALDAALERLEQALAEAFARLPVDQLRTAGSLSQLVEPLLALGALPPGALLDPWGTPLALEAPPVPAEARRGGRGDPWGVGVASAGPDLVLGTADDVGGALQPPTPRQIGGRVGRFLHFYAASSPRPAAECLDSDAERVEYQEFYGLNDAPFEGPMSNNLIGTGGGAGGAFAGRGGSRSRTSGGGGRAGPYPEAVHVRRDFEPTLVFVPETALGPDGHARLSVRLKDALTTWRLRFVASADDGAVGTAETTLVATQPLAAEPWVAPHLTVGDEIDLPVALRNGTEAATAIHARLSVSPELQILGTDRGEVAVGPRGTGAVTFRLRAVASGQARVRVDARQGDGPHVDAVERRISIVRYARPLVQTKSGTVEEGRPFDVALAPPRETWPSERRVQAFPSPLTEVLGSFEGLIACPHG